MASLLTNISNRMNETRDPSLKMIVKKQIKGLEDFEIKFVIVTPSGLLCP